jgi:hypothetical protein
VSRKGESKRDHLTSRENINILIWCKSGQFLKRKKKGKESCKREDSD